MVTDGPSEEEIIAARWRLKGLGITQNVGLRFESNSRDWTVTKEALDELARMVSNRPSLLRLFVSELLEVVSCCPMQAAVQQAYQLLVHADMKLTSDQ